MVLVRLILHPITKKSQVNMMKMQKQMATLQPKIQAIKEKYAKKLREFLGHCALVPAVARQYKTRVEMPGKEQEESKEPTPAQNGAAADAAGADALPVLDEQSLLYDTLRAEMRAYAGAVGSKRDLAQFFERYLR